MKDGKFVQARRTALTRMALAMSGVALGAAGARAEAPDADRSRTSLHQDVVLPAPPQAVYDVLLDAKQFGEVTGLKAEIDPHAGGAFKTFGGLIEGRNVELIPRQRIVQAWRESSWEPGFYSLVHFELTAQDTGTKLALDHTGFHVGDFVHLDPGWHERYWEPLKKYLARRG